MTGYMEEDVYPGIMCGGKSKIHRNNPKVHQQGNGSASHDKEGI